MRLACRDLAARKSSKGDENALEQALQLGSWMRNMPLVAIAGVFSLGLGCANGSGYECPDAGTAHDEIVDVVNETVFRPDAEKCFSAAADCSALCSDLGNYHTGQRVVVTMCELVASPTGAPSWSLGTAPDPADGRSRFVHIVYAAVAFCGA
jgi:hypothetical protein